MNSENPGLLKTVGLFTVLVIVAGIWNGAARLIGRVMDRVFYAAPNFWMGLLFAGVVSVACNVALTNRATFMRNALILLFVVGCLQLWGQNAPGHAQGDAVMIGSGLGYFVGLGTSIYQHASKKATRS